MSTMSTMSTITNRNRPKNGNRLESVIPAESATAFPLATSESVIPAESATASAAAPASESAIPAESATASAPPPRTERGRG